MPDTQSELLPGAGKRNEAQSQAGHGHYREAYLLMQEAFTTLRDAYLASQKEAKPADALVEALNERDLFLNPDMLDQAADEIDCGGFCENIWREGDTNASGCIASDEGRYCPNDVAETLRAVAKVARIALKEQA